MSVKYFTGIDLNKNQLINAQVHVCAGSDEYPSDPVDGQIVYDSVEKFLKVYKSGNPGSWGPVGEPFSASQLGDGTLSANVKATTPAQSSNDTSIATTAYVTQKFGTVDALQYKGTIDGGSTGSHGALTVAANKGDVYKVSTAGKINGVSVEVGDMLICNADETPAATTESGDTNYATVAANWDFIQRNIDGAVTFENVSPGAAQNRIPVFYNDTGKVIMPSSVSIIDVQKKDTAVTHTANTVAGDQYTPVYVASNGVATALGYTIKKSVPADAVFTDHITTATPSGTGNVVANVEADANGALTVTKTYATSSEVRYGVMASGTNTCTVTPSGAYRSTYLSSYVMDSDGNLVVVGTQISAGDSSVTFTAAQNLPSGTSLRCYVVYSTASMSDSGDDVE